MAVALVYDNLGREVLGGAAHGPRAVVHALGEAKVGQPDMTSVVDQHVLGFQVPENDVQVVQILESKDCLDSKRLDLRQRATTGDLVSLV